MGRDSNSEGRGFESQHRILDGHFSHIFVVKIVMMFVWKRPKINEKEAWVGPFFKINHSAFLVVRSVEGRHQFLAKSAIQCKLGSTVANLKSAQRSWITTLVKIHLILFMNGVRTKCMKRMIHYSENCKHFIPQNGRKSGSWIRVKHKVFTPNCTGVCTLCWTAY